MLSANLQRKIRNTGIVFSLALGMMLVSASAASAQYYPQRDRQNRQDDRRDRQRERRDDYNRNRDNDRRNNPYYGNNNPYGNNGYYRNNGYNVARQEGYRDGLNAGGDDARDRERFNPQKHSDFKKATDGYNRSYGDKGQYRQTYRDAFIQGYREAYSRYGNGGYRSNNGRWGY